WAFFASPARAWEFAVGGLAYFVPVAWVRARSWARPLLFWSGVGAIGYSAVVYDYRTLFPGTAALLPVAGTLMVLVGHIQEKRDFPSRLLGNGVMQWLGGRSYSWYL